MENRKGESKKDKKDGITHHWAIPLLLLVAAVVLSRGFVLRYERGSVIIIYFVNYDAEGNDNINLNGEWIEIQNISDQDVDMTGWKLYDESRHCFDFPYGFVLEAGKSVKIYTGSGENTAFELYWGCSKPVWANDGDCAYLVDNSENEVDGECW